MEVSVSSVMTGHHHGVYDLQLYDGFVFSAASDSIVAQWDYKLGLPVQPILTGTYPIYTLSLSEDKLICGQRNGELIIADLSEKKLVTKLQLSSKELFFSYLYGKSEYNWLAGGGEGKLYFGSLNDKDSVHIVSVSTGNLRCVDVCKDADELAIGASDNLIYILSLKDKRIKHVLKGSENSVFTLRYLNENTLISGGRDAHLRLWKREGNNWNESAAIPAHNFTINKIALHPSGKYLASASRDKSIKIWSVDELKLLKVISPDKFPGIHTHSVNAVVWDDDFLITAGDDKKVVVWQISLPL